MKRFITGIAVVLLVVAACAPDSTSPTGLRTVVCHMNGTKGTITEILAADLAEHKSHGDYVTRLEVDRLATPGDSIHFTRVTDAVNAIRAGRIARQETTTAACRMTVLVAPGTFKGTAAQSSDQSLERFPIVIDVPDVTLRGAVKMLTDAAGRATGVAASGDASTFSPTPALIVEGGSSSQQGVSQEIIVVNGHPSGSRGDGAVIEGFVFQGGHAVTDTIQGGQGILSMRVDGLVVQGNRFEGGFTESIDLRATNATVLNNYIVGRANACDICIAGPGNFIIRNNRLDGPGGFPGILSVPATLLPVPSIVEQQILPATSTVTSQIHNNDIRGHLAKPVGVGIRIAGIGIGAPAVIGTSKATVTANNLVSNTFGIIIEAGFPVASGSLRGDIELSTDGNTLSKSCENDLLVSFSRHSTGLGLANQPYVKNSSYVLNLGSDFSWDKAWYAHPAGFGNKLTVNDQVIDNAIHHSYDATKSCN